MMNKTPQPPRRNCSNLTHNLVAMEIRRLSLDMGRAAAFRNAVTTHHDCLLVSAENVTQFTLHAQPCSDKLHRFPVQPVQSQRLRASPRERLTKHWRSDTVLWNWKTIWPGRCEAVRHTHDLDEPNPRANVKTNSELQAVSHVGCLKPSL